MPGPGGLMKTLMDALPGLGPGMNAMAGVTDMVQRLAVLRAKARDRSWTRHDRWREADQAAAERCIRRARTSASLLQSSTGWLSVTDRRRARVRSAPVKYVWESRLR